MVLKIEKKYLTFPINMNASTKNVLLSENGKLVYDFEAKLDNLAPSFTAYVDVERFRGKTLEIDCHPEMKFSVGQSDTMEPEGVYRETWRPCVHYTVKNGWNNDPNGMIRYGDTYHMFYQYNPCGTVWGSMHWGHATSKDLFHWQEEDVALFPDEYGTAYSGSAIEDKNNVSGLKTGKDNPLLCFYTAAGDKGVMAGNKKRTQRLAYSVDGGKTFVRYPHPVLEHVIGYNRDPKVVYAEELGKFVMLLYMEKSDYHIYVSDNLLNWQFLQSITIEGDAECPNIARLRVGESDNFKWVITGAKEIYIVGEFCDGKFHVLQGATRANKATEAYAGQCFEGMGEENAVEIQWLHGRIPEKNFSQQMGIPKELSLSFLDGIYYLNTRPHPNIRTLYSQIENYRNIRLENPFRTELTEKAYDIEIMGTYEPGAVIYMSLFGHNIKMDMASNLLSIGKYQSALSLKTQSFSIRMIVDKFSVEMFSDDGRFQYVATGPSDYNLTALVLQSEDYSSSLDMEIRSLQSIWV